MSYTAPKADWRTADEHFRWAANLWALCAWRAKHYDFDLFIEQQMNEGIDAHDGTRFREEVRE